MFDLAADDGSVRRKPYDSPIPGGGQGEADGPRKVDNLDTDKMVGLHRRLLALYTQEVDRQHDNRMDMAVDADFYDNIQWAEEDARELQERGQVPLVYNVISSSIDWVLGTEKRSRADFQILPRRKDRGPNAKKKTELLKYLSDVNRTPFHTSRAFEDAVKVGIGWLEDAIQDEDDEEPINARYESWRNILWDTSSTELDLKDARYVIRTKWLDLDIAEAIFPKRVALLRRSAGASYDVGALDQYGDDAMDSQEQELERAGGTNAGNRVDGYQRQRVRAIEMWFTMPTKTRRLSGGEFHGEIFDEYSPAHREQVESDEARVNEKTASRMFVAIFTTAGMLYFGESPYRHNRFPFTPIWAYKRDRDGMPYGMIRRLRDLQVDINKRASKALYILSTNKTVVDEGAVEDMDELREEVSRPDAFIVKKPGKDIKFDADRDLAQWHVEMMSRTISLVQSASGVTDENMGRRTNATSGIAIQRRQDQGALATAKLFDNLRLAKQVQGEKQLSLIEQFMTEKKTFRITNAKGKPEYIDVNDGLPENDIVRSKADYVISEADWRASVRQAAADQLLEAMSKLPPAISMVLLDLVVENMDLPNVEEIVKRIRAVTGQRDPDAEEMTPEELAQQEKAAQDEQANAMMFMANLRKIVADAMKSEAQAAQIQSKTVTDKVDAQQKALGAAREAIAMPDAAHVADHILDQSGFVSKDDAAQEAAAAAPPQSPQPGGQSAPGLMAPQQQSPAGSVPGLA